jgi:Protein of unknown function (DUF3435)
MQFACSMSRSIDPRRPQKLTLEQSASVNDLPGIIKMTERVQKLSRAPEGSRTEEKYKRVVKRLRSEKQRQRRLLLIDIKDRYKKEQPVRDSARQLSGKIVDEEVRSELERSENMTQEHLLLIDAIMTLPETSIERELQRRTAAINAVTAYCGVEEGRSYSDRRPAHPARRDASAIVNAEGQILPGPAIALCQAIASVRTDERPKICFLCVGNPRLAIDERVKEYATIGSLSRHFRRHVTKLQTGQQIDCRICDVKLVHRIHLQNHAETCHGTVTRV